MVLLVISWGTHWGWNLEPLGTSSWDDTSKTWSKCWKCDWEHIWEHGGNNSKIEHSDNMRDPMKMWRFKSNSNWSKKMTTIKRNSLQEIPKLN